MNYTSSISYKFFWIGFIVLMISFLVYKFEILGVAALFAIPLGLAFLFFIMGHPSRLLDSALVCAFLAIGVIRYLDDIPLGLTVDFSLGMAFLVAIFHKSLKADFSKLNNGLMGVTIIWMLYCIAESLIQKPKVWRLGFMRSGVWRFI